MLWRNRGAAAAAGLLYPGYIEAAHGQAAMDLQRERYRDWLAPLVVGAWDRLVEHVRSWPATSVISSELFASATPAQAQRALAALSFAEVHLICTARDLARQIPSSWQENIKNGDSATFPEFLTALRTSESDAAGELFWGYQDIPRILRNWRGNLPAERVHLITVPQRGAPPTLLWQRFAAVLGIDPVSIPARPSRNSSLGRAGTELLRRVNAELDGRLDWDRYAAVVKDQLAQDILITRSDPARITIPPAEQQWVAQRALRMIEEIRPTGYHVVGDLAELLPAELLPAELLPAELRPDRPLLAELTDPAEPTAIAATAEPSESTVAEGPLLDIAVAALAELVERISVLPPDAPTAERIRHTLRTLSDQHPELMALRRLYWKGKAQLSWSRPKTWHRLR
jgi:hypothetical protein